MLEKAIICDIDGTLAHMTEDGRLRYGKQAPFMWHLVGEDVIDQTISDLLTLYRANKHVVILLSGRDGVCRPETEKWLEDNHVQYDKLIMRKADDNRKDSIIKTELFDKHIDGKYDVQFILDDRNQVVDMWRDRGLKCLQVAPGDF